MFNQCVQVYFHYKIDYYRAHMRGYFCYKNQTLLNQTYRYENMMILYPTIFSKLLNVV